jgi:hypothetical protein
MIFKPLILTLAVLLTTTLAPSACGEDEVTILDYKTEKLEHDIFTIHYPTGRWKAEKKVDSESRRAFFSLTAVENSSVVIQFMITGGLPAHDPQYEENPHMVNVGAILPVALNVAGKDESRIFISVGHANLPLFSDTTSRASILLENGSALNVEACHLVVPHDDESSLMVAVLSTMSVGSQELNSQNYADLIREAYAIIQAMKYRGMHDEQD